MKTCVKSRNHALIVGDKVFTGMTANEVRKLSAIMAPGSDKDFESKFISVADYIERYHPAVREWTSKKGTEMVTVQILHEIIDRPEDEMSFPKDGIHRNSFTLK